MMDRKWTEFLNKALPVKERISAKAVIEELGEKIGHDRTEPDEGWALALYNYLLDRNFPGEEPLPYTESQTEFLFSTACLLQTLFDEERESLPFHPLYDFAFCTKEEVRRYDRNGEYEAFRKAWRDDFVYELMRIGQEVTPHHTLEHIAGVHAIAMTITRALAEKGERINPAMLSAAAATHDIGKYGCKAGERVPYMHYYYSDKWCVTRDLPGIGRIAANHSAWDLEAENLSAETLALIYSDFRVKQSREEGEERTTIYSLSDSYQVILDKLDNVDEEKKKRYGLVYAKLFDFEQYMIRLGVDVTLSGLTLKPYEEKDSIFLSSDEVVKAFRMMAVHDNLSLTYRFGQERLFSDILEAARGEKNWIRVRAYLDIFEEYYNYLSTSHKVQALDFLFELLISPERDLSRKAAALMGRIVANFNLGYRKQLPEGMDTLPDDELQLAQWERFLEMLIHVDRRFTVRQKSYLHYMLGMFVQHTFEFALPRDRERFLSSYLKYYKDPAASPTDIATALLNAASYLPFENFGREDLDILLTFAKEMAVRKDLPLRTAAMQFFYKLSLSRPEDPKIGESIVLILKDADVKDSIALRYLKNRTLSPYGLQEENEDGKDLVSAAFLENFKTATPWLVKRANLYFLEDQVMPDGNYLHIATHLANLIEISEIATVRYTAGEALLKVGPKLTADQKNEVAIELARGLEVGQFEYSKYIPISLGRFLLQLRASELDEMIDHLESLTISTNSSTASGAIATLGVLLEHYPAYRATTEEDPGSVEKRWLRLLGLIVKQLASHREIPRQEAMWVLGQNIFGSSEMEEEEKAKAFRQMARKLLFILREEVEDKQTQFYLSAMLSHLYRFLVRYEELTGKLTAPHYEKAAFFPGTFDPFTLSHKEIVRQIRDLGFEVYLAVDEFSWRKKTEPGLIRRKIVSMSIADEFHVTLFPHDIPINIANTGDLETLRNLFHEQQVYLVVGSDVITGASAYRALPSEESVHAMNHIIIARDVEDQDSLNEKVGHIRGEVVTLTLPAQYQEISSTRIRDSIDRNQDIMGLTDPITMGFITENGLYRREPLYKPVILPDRLRFHYAKEKDRTTLTLRLDDGTFLAETAMYVTRAAELYSVLQNEPLTDAIRQKASGRLLIVEDPVVNPDYPFDTTLQLVMTDVLSYGVGVDCDHAVFRPTGDEFDGRVRGFLQQQGFVHLDGEFADLPVMLVNLRSPIVLFQNMETVLKDPFASNETVLKTLRKTHRRLQRALAEVYPGQLILSLNAGVIHDRILTKITDLNEVPKESVEPRILGPNMCVPFGKMLRGIAVPNTVTKTIYTEKVYEHDASGFTIRSFPDYAPLRSQVRMIKSFDRPVILVDDMLHTADRIRELKTYTDEEGLSVREVIVGLLSSHGKDQMREMGLSVDCIYFIPNLTAWFTDANLYPFIGGDTVDRAEHPLPGMRPSINLILPYTNPVFYRSSPPDQSYRFSMACLENARDLLLALESEYRELYGRNLTLSRLSDVIELPLCPDKGGAMQYDPNLVASVYLEHDLVQLKRMRGMFQ